MWNSEEMQRHEQICTPRTSDLWSKRRNQGKGKKMEEEAAPRKISIQRYGCNASQWAALAGSVPMCQWLQREGLGSPHNTKHTKRLIIVLSSALCF